MSDAAREFETACDHDRNGREAEAIPHYRRALELGLDDGVKRRALLQLGSSLRNVDKHEDSVAVLTEAVDEFPDYPPLRAFLSLSQHSAGQAGAALANALRLASASGAMDGYERALEYYCCELTS